ncbi:MAG TPA: response regulator [Phototrophicaceae bacterium]|jgi:CheY-like chemotaxis protein|nr:response regulator [Phototrophicaceae bacterium]
MLNWDNTTDWKILLVDDEPDNIEVVAETLEFYGMTVRTAENGKIALETLDGFMPTLILLDLSMPVMDGWQTLRNLKSKPETRNIPVLALSAHAILGDKERAIDVGFNGYMTKPVNVPNLMSDLKTALAANPAGTVKTDSGEGDTQIPLPKVAPATNGVTAATPPATPMSTTTPPQSVSPTVTPVVETKPAAAPSASATTPAIAPLATESGVKAAEAAEAKPTASSSDPEGKTVGFATWDAVIVGGDKSAATPADTVKSEILAEASTSVSVTSTPILTPNESKAEAETQGAEAKKSEAPATPVPVATSTPASTPEKNTTTETTTQQETGKA